MLSTVDWKENLLHIPRLSIILKLMLALVVVRRRVDPFIWQLRHFYLIRIDGVTNLKKNGVLLLIPNLINTTLLHKKTPCLLSFHIHRGIFKVSHIKSFVVLVAAIPSFVHFLQNIYLRHSIIYWWRMSHVVG